MRIIGQCGPSVYLIEVGDNMSRVLDLERGVLFPPFSTLSITARGYWEEYTGDQSILPDLLKKVRHIDTWEEHRRWRV